MRWDSRGVVAASVLMATAALSACGPRQPWQSELVSANADGADSGNGASAFAALSPDGSKVAFTSLASDLGPTDTNGAMDVYVRDLETGATELVSVNATGTDSGNRQSFLPVFSPDGTRIAFVSAADDLGPVRDHQGTGVYLRDLEAGTTELVSADMAPTGLDFALATNPVFSPDGTRIAFAGGAGGAFILFPTDVYVRDLEARTTTLVSVDAEGDPASGSSLSRHTFSPDGSKVVFASLASDLGPTDTNELADVYVRDLGAASTTLASVDAEGDAIGTAPQAGFAFSPDGTSVVFSGLPEGDMSPTDPSEPGDVYVRDLEAGTTTLVSVNAAGTGRANGWSSFPVYSPDGTKVAFISFASDLGPIDTNDTADIYVRDLASGTTQLVTANAAGSGTAELELLPTGFLFSFSPDGTRIAFHARASDLVDVDTNLGLVDVYVRDLVHESTTLVSAGAGGTSTGNGDSFLPPAASGLAGASALASAFPVQPVFSPDGQRVLFVTTASNLGPADQDRPPDQDASLDVDSDVYVATLRGADLSIMGQAEPDPVEPGGTVTYRFDVANAGPDTAEDARVAVLLPEGVTFAGAETTVGECDPPGDGAPTVIVCELGDLPVDGTGEVSLGASVDAPAGTPLAATAAVGSGATADPVHDNNAVVLAPAVAGT